MIDDDDASRNKDRYGPSSCLPGSIGGGMSYQDDARADAVSVYPRLPNFHK